jgi:hypothetical protein
MIDWLILSLPVVIVLVIGGLGVLMLRRIRQANLADAVDYVIHESNLVVCETHNGLIYHLRDLGEDGIPNYSGNSTDARTLCDHRVGWDTKIPLLPGNVNCYICRNDAAERGLIL